VFSLLAATYLTLTLTPSFRTCLLTHRPVIPAPQCGLALHRKCLEVCLLECECGRGVVFGVGLARLCRDQPDGVPSVVRRCTAEIESHSLAVQVGSPGRVTGPGYWTGSQDRVTGLGYWTGSLDRVTGPDLTLGLTLAVL